MSSRLTWYQLRGWIFLVTHSPLTGFWLLQAIVVIAGIVRGISHPAEILPAFGAFGTLYGATQMVARSKGIEPWPPSPRELPPSSSERVPLEP